MKNPAALEVVMFTWDTWRSPGQSPPPFVACLTCDFHNKLTEERCSACGMGLFG